MRELGRVLAADLRDLAVDLSAGGYTRTTLAMLEHNLRRSVPSALGATVSLSDRRDPLRPVTVNLVPRTVHPEEVASVLSVPLVTLGTAMRGTVTFYASLPDAFHDLAADLGAAFDLAQDDLDRDARPPTRPIEPGITGLLDFSLVNRALGVLLNRGHSLPGARLELQSRAADARTDIVDAARAVLASEHY